jgi:hypothetical protein
MNRTLVLFATTALAVGGLGLAGLPAWGGHHAAAPGVAAAAAPIDTAPNRQAFFGDLHLHTTFSFDAYALMGTKTTPEEAYRFARGEPITYFGHTVQRSEPLDFMAVTDHSEFQGVLNQIDDRASPLANSALGKRFVKEPLRAFFELTNIWRHKETAPPELNAKDRMASTWALEVAAANQAYQPGKFTTFVAYEYTSMPQAKFNLHRNVIFKDAPPPIPFSSADSLRPEDLWTYMENLRAKGVEGLVIPHNSNASGGLMFDWKDSDGRPISEAYAQRRALNEPLVEIYQNKGGSETVPELSSADEFANFEVMEHLLTGGPSPVNGSYVRQALGRGLVIEHRVGINPYKLGIVGATDYHNGLSTGRENEFAGGVFGVDPRTDLPDLARTKKIMAGENVPPNPYAPPADHGGAAEEIFTDPTLFGSGGMTGVWAEQNTRESIYAALRRRETFATSGDRMRVRFFGGWSYPATLVKDPEWVAKAYGGGVPMGGDLPQRAGGRAPRFVVWAQKDPNTGNLDRVQIVKVWLDGDDYREKVFDVVWAGARQPDPHTGKLPPVGNTVDLKTATYANTIGAGQLAAVWRDPEFDPGRPAVYYARALEIPTPRWTTILAARKGLPVSTHGPATLQERAWSSPIWYSPATSRKTAKVAQAAVPKAG